MRTETISIYKFDELAEEAQQKALEEFSNINIDYEWWEATFEDAKTIGLKLTGFNIGVSASGEFLCTSEDVANAIINEHGGMCETYKTAKEFLGQKHIENYSEACSEFKQSLLEDYRTILSKEYDYLTSEEAIKETIEANDYEFTAEGKRY